MNGELSQRFYSGSPKFGTLIPGTYEHSFLVRMPQDVQELRRELRDVASRAADSYGATIASMRSEYAEQNMVLNEVNGQLEDLREAVGSGFHDVAQALEDLECTLGVEFGKLRWVLGQVNDTLANLLHVAMYPRATEAGELVGDGSKALAAGHLEDAERCLQNAFSLKRTSYEVHTSLGFLYLEKCDQAQAFTHFQKAVDYSQDQEPDIRVLTLENLARAHYAARDFESACRAMERALAIRKENNLAHARSSYLWGLYEVFRGNEAIGLGQIVDACRTDPRLFLVATLESELTDTTKTRLLTELEELADTTLQKGQDLLEAVDTAFCRTVTELPERKWASEEIALMKRIIKRAGDLLEKRSYSSSIQASLLLEKIQLGIPLLDKLCFASDFVQELESSHSEIDKHLQREFLLPFLLVLVPVVTFFVSLTIILKNHEFEPVNGDFESIVNNGAFNIFSFIVLSIAALIPTAIAGVLAACLYVLYESAVETERKNAAKISEEIQKQKRVIHATRESLGNVLKNG